MSVQVGHYNLSNFSFESFSNLAMNLAQRGERTPPPPTFRMSHRPSRSLRQFISEQQRTYRQTNKQTQYSRIYIQTRQPVLASPEPLLFLVHLQQYRSQWCSWSTCSSVEVIGVHGQLAVVLIDLMYLSLENVSYWKYRFFAQQ